MRPKVAPAVALALLGACAAPLRLQVLGIKPLNENDRKESTPVDVRIYLLKDNARFERATIEGLWTKDKETLAEDLVSVKTVTVFPGAEGDKPQEVDLGIPDVSVRFVGVLGLYSREEAGQPRKVVVPVREADAAVWEFTGYRVRRGK